MMQKRGIKHDIILKNYWCDNERFADFFNAVLFHEEQRILPEELEGLESFCFGRGARDSGHG